MKEDFDFENARVVQVIRERACRKVLLQFPEGLKRRAPEVASALSSLTDATIIISGDQCFGACDIPATDADLIVQYGHLPIPCLETPKSVMYIQARSSADPIPVLEAVLPRLSGTVGLLTTAQHIHFLVGMADFLGSKGLKVLIGKGESRLYADGQVLGCNASCARAVADKVDAFLFVGTGDFHPLAVSLATSKPVFAADPMTLEVRDMSEQRDRLLRQRHAAIERARSAKRIGIIISSKIGQRRERAAVAVVGMLESAGFTAILTEMDLITPAKLDTIGLDAWVSTACPRLAIDDSASFRTPVLTVPEAEILAGKRAWENYILDEI
ncbi:MAG: diphthamide biosynthesis enzyme Dph2 [Thermoplasmata archaeon]|nr:diphthamide biosynthesis enzyme Dph2 [Thermoplasmata archaeon]